MEYTNRLVDIIHEGIDVAIRVGELPDSSLSARRLGEVVYGLYAAPDYLKRAPNLSTVSDLEHHDLIIKPSRGRSSWTLVNGMSTEIVDKSPRAAVNSIIAAKNLALAGLGITQLPRFMAVVAVRGKRPIVLRPVGLGREPGSGTCRLCIQSLYGPKNAQFRRSLPGTV